MKAVLAGTVIADADESDLVRIEGNWYFPPASITPGALVESPTPYTCPWKGDAQYFSMQVDDDLHTDLRLVVPDPVSLCIRPRRQGLLGLRRLRPERRDLAVTSVCRSRGADARLVDRPTGDQP